MISKALCAPRRVAKSWPVQYHTCIDLQLHSWLPPWDCWHVPNVHRDRVFVHSPEKQQQPLSSLGSWCSTRALLLSSQLGSSLFVRIVGAFEHVHRLSNPSKPRCLLLSLHPEATVQTSMSHECLRLHRDHTHRRRLTGCARFVWSFARKDCE